MEYWLTEDQELIQNGVHDFLSAECAPTRVRAFYDSGERFDHALWKEFTQLGFTGLCIPAEQGGSGFGLMEAALVSEELGRHTAPGFLEGHTLAGLAVALGGSADQRERLLPGLASGERVASLALAAPNTSTPWACWDIEPGASGAVAAALVPAADVADLFIVGCSGGRVGVVERERANLVERDTGALDRSRHLFEISFDASAVDLLPEVDGETLCTALTVLLAADAFGAAHGLLDLTVAYAKEREQFGQPIAQFQSVKHQLAEFALAAHTSRGVFWKAAREFDARAASAARSASLAKAHITDLAHELGRGAVELHGGLGFTWECDVQFYFKRVLFDRTYLGTPEMHRARCADLAGWNR